MTYLNIWIYDVEQKDTQKKEERFDVFKKEEFKKIVGDKIVRVISIDEKLPKNLGHENFYNMKPDISNECQSLVAELESEDKRNFQVELMCRVDNSPAPLKDGLRRSHVNFYLRVRDKDTGKHEKVPLEMGHIIVESKRGTLNSRTIHFSMGSPTPKGIVMSTLVFLAGKKDKIYFERQHEFFKKLKEGKLKPKDEIVHKRIFDKYSAYMRGRDKKFWSEM